MYRSPGGPPFTPALPLPGTRTRDPVSAPGGMRTSNVSGLRTEPRPLQAGQGCFWRPLPPHWGQGPEKRMAPACRSEEHTSELQSPCNLVCRLLLEKKKNKHEIT